MKKEKNFKLDNLGLVQSFFEKSTEGVLVADFQTKKFIYANEKICKMLGYTQEEILRLGVSDIHKKQDLKKIYGKFMSLPIGKKKTARDLPVLRKDRKIIFCDIAGMKILVNNKSVAVGFFQEVSSIKEITEEIIEKERTRQAVFNTLPGLLVIIDLKGQIRFINGEGSRLLNKKYDEVIGENFFVIFPNKELIFKKIFSSVIKHGRNEEFEDEIKKPDGTVGNFLTIVKPIRDSKNKIVAIQINSIELKARRALEKISRGKELLYSEMFEGSVIPMFVIDKNHTITHWNRACEQLSGVPAEKMVGTKDQWKPFYPKRRPVLADLVLNKTTSKNIARWYTKSGQILVKKSLVLSDVFQGENFFPKLGRSGKWLYFVATTIKNKRGEVIGAIETLEDVTTEKIDKQRLIENEKLYHDLYDNIPGIVYRCLNDKNWTIISISRAIQDLSGYNPENVVGNRDISLENMIHPDDREYVRKGAEAAFREDKVYELDYRIIAKNREIRWVSDRGRAIFDSNHKIKYIDAILFDITEKKKVAMELRKEKELTSKYLELVGAMVVVLDKNGRVVLINRAGLDILERRQEEVVGKDWFMNFLPEKDKRPVKKVFQNIISGKVKMAEFFENDVVSSSGKQKTISWHNSFLQMKDSDEFYVISSGMDVTETRRISKELEESERKYRTLVEFASDSILLIDSSGKITEANQAITKHLGYDKDFIVGKNIKELTGLIPPESMRTILKNFSRRLLGVKSEPYTINLLSQKGELGFFEISASLIRDKGKKLGVMAIIRNVNEREKSKLALEESEYKYRSLVANLPNAIYTVLPDKHRTCLYMSERWEKWTGYSPDDFYANNHLWFKTVHSNDRKNLSLKLLSAFSDGDQYIAEYRLVNKNGKTKFVLDQGIPNKNKFGEIVNYNGIVTDITRLKEVENDLKRSEGKLQIIVDEIGDGILVVDKNCKVIMFNKQAEIISGFDRHVLIGRCYEDVLTFVSETSGKKVKDFLRASIKKGEEAHMRNHTLLMRKDGTKISIAKSISVLKDQNDEITGCVMVFRDISREREIDKMKSEFVSVASHQLKTPLSGIKWFTELLLREKAGQLTEKQVDFINQIRTSNERLISLVTDLLSVSHIETKRNFEIKKRKANVHNVIEKVIKLYSPLAQNKSIRITHQDGRLEKISIPMDVDKIQQVFQNLVVNAVKYSPAGREILIGAEERAEDVVFFVRDQGIGIDAKESPKIFTKFYRGEDAMKLETNGTGLGLYIAKAIIEAHDGSMWFDSEKGKGSTFYFLLKK